MHTLMSGLAFGESPRWYDDRLWFSDMGADQLIAVDLAGNSEVIANVSGPMGTGWLPDGRFLVVASNEGRILRREADATMQTYADLSALAKGSWSDMVVDGRGNAYLGNIGFQFGVDEFRPGTLVLVRMDGSVVPVADDIAMPNGVAVTPDNNTLILAESYGNRLTAFDIAADGSLSNRRVWAWLDKGVPDGICIDAEGAVWYADVPNQRCVRVREGGEVLQTIELDRGCFACALGGPGRRTLFLMAAKFPGIDEVFSAERTGQMLTVEAPAPGVGWP